MKDEKQTTAVKTAAEPKYTKAQLLGAKKFRDSRDALGAVLNGDSTYTVTEAEKALRDFYERIVK